MSRGNTSPWRAYMDSDDGTGHVVRISHIPGRLQ